MGDWSQAPKDVLGLIAEHLNLIEDYTRFGVVCKTWRSVTVDQRGFHYSPKTLPWLMFPLCKKDKVEHDNNNENPTFFSLSENKFYKVNLPEVLNCSLSGSAYGWLIRFSGAMVEIFNPLSRVRVPLPPLSTFEDYSPILFIPHKAFLATPSDSSIKPVEDQFVVLVSFLGKFAFVRPQDRTWTAIKPSPLIEDILHFNNQFYAIDKGGVVRQLDLTSTSPFLTEFASPPLGTDPRNCYFYLVELLGELHMVRKYVSMGRLSESHHLEPNTRPFVHSQMMHFVVFKLDLHTRKWEQIFTLGDYAIFVGNNTSFSLPVSDYPHCKRSSIYFTDHFMGEGRSTGNIGVFNLETQGLKTLFTGDDVVSLYSTPVWFIPKLC